jgi:hypothetical protein
MGGALKKLHRKKDQGQSEHDHSTPAAATSSAPAYGRAPTDTVVSNNPSRTRGDQNASSSAAAPTTTRGVEPASEGVTLTRGQT